MTRAEKAALKAYPIESHEMYDLDYRERNAFVQGYKQCEKDYVELAQLWVDSGDANVMSFKQFLKRHETQSNK